MLIYTELGKGFYLVQEDTDRGNKLNSLLLEDGTNSRVILIDSNYPFKFIDELYTRVKAPVLGIYYSHCHLDHTAHAYYHQEKYGAPIYVPVQEKEHLLSLDALMEDVGYNALGLKEMYFLIANDYMKFQECKTVNTFNPGIDTLDFDTFVIETIHIPGHSPGHTAFIIKRKISNHSKKLMFIGDIGSHPYYGDLYCDLAKYRESLDKLETLYFSDDFILIPAHGTVKIEKDKDYFERIRERIKRNEQIVMNALNRTHPKSIRELVQKEYLFTSKERMHPIVKDGYLLWDGGMILLHFKEFLEQGIIKRVEEKSLLDDTYVLSE